MHRQQLIVYTKLLLMVVIWLYLSRDVSWSPESSTYQLSSGTISPKKLVAFSGPTETTVRTPMVRSTRQPSASSPRRTKLLRQSQCRDLHCELTYGKSFGSSLGGNLQQIGQCSDSISALRHETTPARPSHLEMRFMMSPQRPVYMYG